jgi:hypothetical protein
VAFYRYLEFKIIAEKTAKRCCYDKNLGLLVKNTVRILSPGLWGRALNLWH